MIQFNNHDTDSLVLADIRQLLYILSIQHVGGSKPAQLARFEWARMENPLENPPARMEDKETQG